MQTIKSIIGYLTVSALLLFGAQAQSPTLDITGSASIGHKPTQCVVTFQIMLQSASYESVLKMLNTDIAELTSTLKKQGFKQEEVITQQFDISKNRRYVNGTWKDEGYNAQQQLNVVFPIDQDRLIKVLNASTSSGSQPEVTIRFEIDDATRAKLNKELIKLAVLDAREKGDLIVETAGYQITGIEQINYGTTRYQPVVAASYKMAEASLSADAGFGPMEAQSISLSDQVQIKFVIAPK